MIEFSKQIAEKWNIPVGIAEQVCNAFAKGDSPYYLSEYHIDLCNEFTASNLWEINDFLQEMNTLSSKKKRVSNAYKKAGSLSPELERRISLTTNSFELDDLLISVRPNPRSRGQIAAKKGLKPLADQIFSQGDEGKSIGELAEPCVGKDPSLTSVEEVIQGVKDVLAEMMAYDETVRAMAREFAFEDGFFEVIPKNKKDPAFSRYIARSIPVHELSNEEILTLIAAEDKKQVRLKLGVQLFRITELLRHHFITNPDAAGFDLICETIDDCWLRLLQPIVERDVKGRFRARALEWAIRQVVSDLEKAVVAERENGPLLIADAGPSKHVLFCAVSGTGELLGTTTERKTADNHKAISERLKQFIGRYRSGSIAVIDNDDAELAESLLGQVTENWDPRPEIGRYRRTSAADTRCEWIAREFDTLLNDTMKQLYKDALLVRKPIALLSKIGLDFYEVHPFQPLMPGERFIEIVNRILTSARLKTGVPIKGVLDSPLREICAVTPQQIQSIRTADAEGVINGKNDILKVPGINEVAFRNIAGFIMIPGAESLLDRTVVHPDYFDWFDEIAEQLNVSLETILTEPECLHSFSTEDLNKKLFIDQRLTAHIAAARRYLMQPSARGRRKLKLSEITEGTVVSGRVTNITQFGVFVNISAVCDGLIHISQLADEYVETPEQVVSINDRVDVRILKVDVKKRRISLSMRNLGQMAPKVKPSRGQLDNLAEFFKNR